MLTFPFRTTVIQGAGAVPTEADSLTEAEVQKTIDFCAKVFGGGMHQPNGVAPPPAPVSDEPELLATDESQVKTDANDEETIRAIKDVTARKKLHAGMYDVAGQFGISDAEGAKGGGNGAGEVFVGLRTCCERGKLGLLRAE